MKEKIYEIFVIILENNFFTIFFFKILTKKSIIVCVLLGATAVTGQDRRIRSRSRQRRLQEDGPVRGRRLQSRRNDGRSRRMGGRRQ